jgi:hypothetical protein
VDAFNQFVSSLFGNQKQQSSSSSDQGGGEGKAAGQLEAQVTQEDQLFLSSAMQVGFNALSLGMGETLNMLAAYQLVFMCYLFLMGPIAACFYAWPAGIGGLFKKVFSNWLDAVVVLSLWRFWWCVILAVMTQRINYVHPNAGSPSEMMVYNCFLALLLYIPFQPFNFKPGDMVSRVLEQAGVGGCGGGEGGGGHGGLQGEHADAGDGGVSGRPARSSVRRDSRAGREMAVLAGGTAGRSTHMPAMSSGVAAARQVSAPPMADHQVKAGKAVTGHPSAVPAVASVPGREVSASPPPLTAPAGGSVQPNPALDAVRTQYPAANVESIANGAPPTVPLSATSAPRVFLNTADPALAQNGMQAWGKGLASRNQMPEKQNNESSTGGKNVNVGLPPSRS